MDQQEFAARVRKRLRGPAAEKVAAAIIADADQLLAWGIEYYAHPRYPWMDKAEGAGTPAGDEEAAAELPGAEA